MFEATRRRSVAPLVTALLLTAAAAGYALRDRWLPLVAPAEVGPPAEAAGPEVAPPPSIRGTKAEAWRDLKELTAEHRDARLYHLDCHGPTCVATVRMPVPKGADGTWRYGFEAALEARGWTRSPKGQVKVLKPMQAGEVWLPERAFYVLSLHGDRPPLTDAEEATVKERIVDQGSRATFAVEPW